MRILPDKFKLRIVRPRKVALIFEQIHLQRFFKYFNVDCVFDVGANTGQYATMLRRQVGYKGPIISFEPIPDTFKILQNKSRSDSNWYVEEVALDIQDGKKIFNIMEGEQFSSLHEPSQKEVDLFKNLNQISKQIMVTTSNLNVMIKKYKKSLNFSRPFLKMDTQGNDLEIAKATGNSLSSFVGIQSELSIKKIYKNTPIASTVIDYYRSHNFELSAFVPNNEGHFPRLIEIDCIMYNRKYLNNEPDPNRVTHH
jgi:FkbM family methyltransferase